MAAQLCETGAGCDLVCFRETEEISPDLRDLDFCDGEFIGYSYGGSGCAQFRNGFVIDLARWCEGELVNCPN